MDFELYWRQLNWQLSLNYILLDEFDEYILQFKIKIKVLILYKCKSYFLTSNSWTITMNFGIHIN